MRVEGPFDLLFHWNVFTVFFFIQITDSFSPHFEYEDFKQKKYD